MRGDGGAKAAKNVYVSVSALLAGLPKKLWLTTLTLSLMSKKGLRVGTPTRKGCLGGPSSHCVAGATKRKVK